MKRYIKSAVVTIENLDEYERIDVAYYTDDVATIRELARDPDYTTKWALLLNKHTPEDILENLCQEFPSAYAESLAINPNTSSSLLSVFLKVYGRHSDVGTAVINNPSYIGD